MLEMVQTFLLTITPLLIVLPFIILFIFIKTATFNKTEYAKLTKNKYFKTLFDKGLYGEYLIYSYLKNLKGTNKFLFNVYLPKDNGETTEVDVLLINQHGIFVFESKNYSGWIFGKENQMQWTMTLPSGNKSKKYRFLNPIMQNELHIKWLKSMLKEFDNVKYHSIIAFSNRCTLKKIELTENKAKVINRDSVKNCVKRISEQSIEILTEQRIQELYEILYPCSQVTEEAKQQHIADIKKITGIPVAVPVEVPAPVVKEPLPLVIETYDSEEPVVQKKICSKCGCEMVLRTAKTGENAGKQFWGCSGFPKCRNLVNY